MWALTLTILEGVSHHVAAVRPVLPKVQALLKLKSGEVFVRPNINMLTGAG